MGEMIYHGKVKQVWSTDDPDIIEFRYTDQISVFDQIIPSLVPGKGESLNRTSCHWFKLVEDENICETHIIEMNAPDRVRARRFDVVKEPGAIAKDRENVFVPLEVICRHYLAGSGWRRVKRGDVSAEELGFAPGTELKEGMKLPKPYLEVSTKFEKFDRLLDRKEALEISNLTDDEFDAIMEIVLKVDAIIEREAAKRGLAAAGHRSNPIPWVNRILTYTYPTRTAYFTYDAELDAEGSHFARGSVGSGRDSGAGWGDKSSSGRRGARAAARIHNGQRHIYVMIYVTLNRTERKVWFSRGRSMTYGTRQYCVTVL